MIEVRDLDDQEMFRFYGTQLFRPIKGYAARRGLRTVAVGGLMQGSDGKIWGFIDFKPGYRLKALYKYTRKTLEWAADRGIAEIRVSRDTSFNTSERLLTRAGFELLGQHAEGLEIWVWRNKKVAKDVRD